MNNVFVLLRKFCDPAVGRTDVYCFKTNKLEIKVIAENYFPISEQYGQLLTVINFEVF